MSNMNSSPARPRVKDPNYHMGNHTGYRLVNGLYHIAPVYQEQFARLQERADGINLMLKAVTRHASEDLQEITRLQKQIWKDIKEDIGLDPNVSWEYTEGVIRKQEVK